MGKAIKIISAIILVVVILFVAAAAILMFAVDPNNYKMQITKFVKNQTGRELVIKGKLGWSFIPWLGVNVHDVVVGNPPGFQGKNFAEIGDFQVRAKFWPLLAGKVVVDRIVLQNSTFNLIKNAKGQTNWQDWSSKPSVKSQQIKQAQTQTQSQSSKQSSFIKFFRVGSLNVVKTNVNFINEKTREQTHLENFSLALPDIAANKVFPMQSSFTLKQTANGNVISIGLKSNIQYLTQQQQLNLKNLQLTADVKRPNLPTIPVRAQANVQFDVQPGKLYLRNLKLMLANLDMVGDMQIFGLNAVPAINAKLATATSSNVQQLMQTLLGKYFMTGKLTFAIALQTRGSSSAAMLSQLNGNCKLQITDGKLLGFNMNGITQAIYQLTETKLGTQAKQIVAQKLAPMQGKAAATAFYKLSATYVIRNGVLSNNDLQLTSQQLTMNGAGTVNLPRSVIDYKLTTLLKLPKLNTTLPLPVLIQGSLAKPKVTVDYMPIIQLIIEKQIGNSIKQNLEKKVPGLKKFFGL